MANSQTDRAPTEIDKNGAVVQVRILFRFRDTIRNLQTFRVISNEMLVFLLILC